MTQIQEAKITVDIAVMQFGQPYRIGGETHLSEMDGVHARCRMDGRDVLNLRMTPEQAFDFAKALADSAGKAHAARARGEGRHPLAGLGDLFRGEL